MSGPTSEARRKRVARLRAARLVIRLTHRPLTMRFHPDDSCGGHLSWSLYGRMRRCPDAMWDLSREPKP